MEQSFGNIFISGERRTEAVTPDVDQKFCTLSGAEGVAVDTDDTGHCAAVGVESGGGVVGFDFVRNVALVIEVDDTGVVFEHRNKPGYFRRDLFGAFLDIAFIAG